MIAGLQRYEKDLRSSKIAKKNIINVVQLTVDSLFGSRCRSQNGENDRINFTIYKLYIVIFHVRRFFPLMRKLSTVNCTVLRLIFDVNKSDSNIAIRLFIIFR